MRLFRIVVGRDAHTSWVYPTCATYKARDSPGSAPFGGSGESARKRTGESLAGSIFGQAALFPVKPAAKRARSARGRTQNDRCNAPSRIQLESGSVFCGWICCCCCVDPGDPPAKSSISRAMVRNCAARSGSLAVVASCRHSAANLRNSLGSIAFTPPVWAQVPANGSVPHICKYAPEGNKAGC
jgi:hypothetical protein